MSLDVWWDRGRSGGVEGVEGMKVEERRRWRRRRRGWAMGWEGLGE